MLKSEFGSLRRNNTFNRCYKIKHVTYLLGCENTVRRTMISHMMFQINLKGILKVWTLICFLLSVRKTYQLQFKPSPCPSIFRYEKAEEDDRWYGAIRLTINKSVDNADFRVVLDRQSQLLVSWSGPAATTDNKVYIGSYAGASELMKGTTYSARIMVKFDKSKTAPMLESVYLNGYRICPPASGGASNAEDHAPTRPDPPTIGIPPDSSGSFNSIGSTSHPSQGSIISNTGGSNTNNESNTGNSNEAISRPFVTTGTKKYAASTEKHSGTWDSQNTLGNFGNDNEKSGSNAGTWNPGSSSGAGFNGVNNVNGQHGHLNSNLNSHNNPNNVRSSGSANQVDDDVSSHGGQHSGSVVPCGTVSKVNTLITKGQNTHRGQWPWHTALYKNQGIDLLYMCGGSLVSKNKVITAAHCVVSNPGNKILNYKSLSVFLGKFNLNQNTAETGVQTRGVSRLNVNPTYNSSNFAGDIAILTLTSDVDYTEYVRPVCLWEATNGVNDIAGKEGVVAGWGLTEYEQASEELKMATLPVVSTEACFRSHPKFYSEYLSDTAFCAGFHNGTSPCNGDSGGGLVFKRNNSTWYLRGIVSLSVAKDGLNFCDPKYYVIFTDTSRYVEFIKKNVT